MQIEKMEQILADFVNRRSSALGQPIRQSVHLVKKDIGIKVGQQTIEIGLPTITSGANLEALVEDLIRLDWELFRKEKEEKLRRIEQEKVLARAHILELKRLTSNEDFTTYMKSFLNGRLVKRGG